MPIPKPRPVYRTKRKSRKKGAAVFCDAFLISCFYAVFVTAILCEYRLVLLRNLLPVEYLEECLYVIRAQVLIL